MDSEDKNVIYGGDTDLLGDGPVKTYASIGHMLISDFKAGGNKTCLINGASNKTWTFHEVLSESKIMSKVLNGLGVKPNDVVAIVSENRHEFAAIAFGAFYLNAVVTPVSVIYTQRELKHTLDLSKPNFVFVSAFAEGKLLKACKSLSYVKNVILIDGRTSDGFALSLEELVAKHQNGYLNVEHLVETKVNKKEQVALIVYSSGTTGLPKGVMITHENIISVVESYRSVLAIMKMMQNQTLVILNIAPWFHTLGFTAMLMVACVHDPIFVFLPKFEDEAFLRSIEKYKINTITIVPPIMVFLAKSPLVDKFDLSSLKEIGCGAAALSKEVEDQVRDRLKGNITIRQGYGMSESTLGVMSPTVIFKPGSVGEVLKTVYVKVIDEDGKSLGPNQHGELCFKGDRIMKGYIGDVKATNETIDKDGWLHSGDIGYYDEDKQFFIVDRLKELIKYKANQVPPAEIEALLLTNPKIKDCSVIGIPDEESGELPFAYVVIQPGASLREEEVIDFVSKNASKAKWLRGGVKFIDEIPRNPSGKMLRRELRDLYKSSKSKL